MVRLAVGSRLGEPLTRDPYDQRVDGWLRYSLCGMKRAFPASSDITNSHVSAGHDLGRLSLLLSPLLNYQYQHLTYPVLRQCLSYVLMAIVVEIAV